MSAEPIKELISQNVKATIEAVTVANGYHYTLTAQRSKHIDFEDGDTPVDLLAIVMQGDEEEVEIDSNNSEDWIQPYNIAVFIMEEDDLAYDTRKNLIEADIRKQFQVDFTRGGLAIDTITKPSIIFETADGLSGLVINIDVKYRTAVNDPYRVG